MTQPRRLPDADALAALLLGRPPASRTLVAIAGAPGSGKSTLAEALAARLPDAAVLPMDGYHLDDGVLAGRGLLARKGAPETFDVGGLAHMIARLRANEEAEIAVPVFDREIEIARAGARLIPRSVRTLVVEGNYLLLDEAPWAELRARFDLTVMVEVAEPELRRRLIARWRGLALPEDEVVRKVEGNDLPNGRRLRERSAPADVVIAG
ncbi:nucleoside/nucleotide kinase family protein [Ancylobacter terrae]|uniref:nucleoside/nucleotide kinase family protein n=1 Tax=Ancylobacter sp. sgz301288 TaxID=3342077 RepID=UPI00385C35F3